MALAVTLYQVSVGIHVMAVVVGFGATFANPVIQMTAERAFPQHLPLAWRAIHMSGKRLAIPAGVLIGATGLYQTIDAHWDLGANQWLAFGIALWLVIMGLGSGFATPRELALAEESERMVMVAGPGGDVVQSDEYRRLVKPYNLIGPLLGVLVLVAVVLMEVKPF